MPHVDLEPLARAARSGDHDAEQRLYSALYRLTGAIIVRSGWFFPVSWGDLEDLIQEGMVGAMEALHQWDGRQSFTQFAKLCIRRELYTSIRTADRVKHRILTGCISLDKPLTNRHNEPDEQHTLLYMQVDHSAVGADPADLVGSDSAQAILTALSEGLSDLERHMLRWCLLEDASYIAACELWRRAHPDRPVARKSADNALQRARRKIARRIAAMATDEHLSPETRWLLREAAERDGRKGRGRGQGLWQLKKGA